METTPINILYRGPLESCNYDCQYCPFAKKKNTREELQYDKACLDKFVEWVANQKREISILFTPWGEALIRKYYQESMVKLSHMKQVKRVAIQTNLSSRLEWLQEADKNSIALWTTFHPTEISIQQFLEKCNQLQQLGVRFSVGIVGKLENFDAAQQLRTALPKTVYVWVNAYKRVVDYYSKKDIVFLNSIDPLLNLNNTIYKTKGKPCFAGESSISIDGKGNVTRCHFIKNKIGNIYQQSLSEILKPTDCTNENCRCYIGYINLKELNLQEVYGANILERIPKLKLCKQN